MSWDGGGTSRAGATSVVEQSFNTAPKASWNRDRGTWGGAAKEAGDGVERGFP
jgi:hypothetical protein